MAWALERVLGEAVELLGSIIEDLEAGGQRLSIRLLEVATANNKETLRWRLDILKVVLECEIHIDSALLHAASLKVELNHIFTVLFAHIEGELREARRLLNCNRHWLGLNRGDGLRSILHCNWFTLTTL